MDGQKLLNPEAGARLPLSADLGYETPPLSRSPNQSRRV